MKERVRPFFPKRAIVTAGMPYGNKELHFGHIGGMIVHADFFARFLKDRIGDENVIFQSGTDCYGSPISEGYRKGIESGSLQGSIFDYVKRNHELQVKGLQAYQIKFDIFEGSALGKSKDFHDDESAWFFNTMYKSGHLKKMDTMQYYDEIAESFLNGRQVVGKCPIEGCKSEKAYADECDLGHQFMPKDLINPISSLSGTKPVLKPITNWYLDMEAYTDFLNGWLNIYNDQISRDYVSKEFREFFKKPEIYIIRAGQREKFNEIKKLLPSFRMLDDAENKPSFTISFKKLEDREKACGILSENSIRFRTGKTLVPFRLTANIEWGVKVPTIEGLDGLTFYCWPESLWSPISFTRAFLSNPNKNVSSTDFKDWWCSKDAQVYQFLGEDNAYFYGPCEMAMFDCVNGGNFNLSPQEGQLQFPILITNKHILYMGGKASSSGNIKPPMALDLLNFYNAEQLRMHFLGMGLGNNNVSFSPKELNPNANAEEQDPVLKEGNLLTNVYNRVLRYIINCLTQNFDGKYPQGQVSTSVKEDVENTVLNFEKTVSQFKFHVSSNIVDCFVRNINKFWSKAGRDFDQTKDKEMLAQNVIDTLYMIRIANTLLHPFVPDKTEYVAEYFGFNKKSFDWKYIFDDFSNFVEKDFKIKELPPKFDFFTKAENQW